MNNDVRMAVADMVSYEFGSGLRNNSRIVAFSADEIVEPAFACPKCQENREGWLIWDDGDRVGMVTCQACGCVYDPEDEEW